MLEAARSNSLRLSFPAPVLLVCAVTAVDIHQTIRVNDKLILRPYYAGHVKPTRLNTTRLWRWLASLRPFLFGGGKLETLQKLKRGREAAQSCTVGIHTVFVCSRKARMLYMLCYCTGKHSKQLGDW